MSARKYIPDPNLDGTDPNEVLRSRLLNTPVGSASTPSTPAHTQPTSQVRKGTGKGRPDPEGMRRISLYVTADAADALDQAATSVLAALGGDVPRHVALSALLEAGARQAPEVAQQLVQQRTAELAARLQALQHQSTPEHPGMGA